MAKKEESKIVLERTYNVPLRMYWSREKYYKKTKRAVTGLKEFILKHMKGTEVKIGIYLNNHLWKHGIQNPPHHVKVIAKKNDKGVVTVELPNLPAPRPDKKAKRKAAAAKATAAKGQSTPAASVAAPAHDHAGHSHDGHDHPAEMPKKKAPVKKAEAQE